MKFSQFVTLKEADVASEIDGIFQQTDADISKMFDQLYQGTAAMVRNAQGSSGGGAALPTQFLSGILNDLKQIAQKVKDAAKASGGGGGGVENNTDPRIPKSENVMVDLYLKDVWEAVSAVDGLGKTGESAAGKGVYDFKSTLNNVRNMVRQRMETLRASVLKAMGMVSDIHKGVGALGGTIDKVHQGQRTLTSLIGSKPVQNSAQADQSAWTLAALLKHNPSITLGGHPGLENFTKSADIGVLADRLRDLGDQHHRITLNVGGQDKVFDMDDVSSLLKIQELMKTGNNAGMRNAWAFLTKYPNKDNYFGSEDSNELIDKRSKTAQSRAAGGERLKAAREKKKQGPLPGMGQQPPPTV